MSEIFVSYLVLNGVHYTYTAMYVMNTLLFYSEVHHKLSFIWLNKRPNRKQLKHLLNYTNTTSELIGNGYGVYVATNKKNDDINNKQKYNTEKKNNINYNYKQKMRFPYFWSLIDYISEQRQIARAEKRQKRDERLRKIMQKYKAKQAEKEEEAEQKKMANLGYTYCRHCKKYMAPDKMLEKIACEALKIADDSKKFTPCERDNLHKLILNTGNREPQDAVKFEKYDAVFKQIKIKCPCGEVYGANCENDGCMFHVERIVELQQKKIDLVYLNRQVIEFEAPVVE